MNRPEQTPVSAAKKEYRTPQLTEYGDVRQLTQGRSALPSPDGGGVPNQNKTI